MRAVPCDDINPTENSPFVFCGMLSYGSISRIPPMQLYPLSAVAFLVIDMLEKCDGIKVEKNPSRCDALYTGMPPMDIMLCELSHP